MTLAAAAAASLPAQEASFSGSVKSAAGAYVYGEDNAGHVSLAEETVSGTIDASAGNCSAYVTGKISFDSLAAARTGTLSAADGFFSGPDGDGEYGVYRELSNVRLSGVYRF